MSQISAKENLLNLTLPEIQEWFAIRKEPSFRAKQFIDWVYKKRVFDFEDMTNFSKKTRQMLQEQAICSLPQVTKQEQSEDGTQKFLLQLEDKRSIEAVLIPESSRNTLCVSSQVGCALGCKFCYTATMGAGRNLSVSELVGQFLLADSFLPEGKKINNVVFMGMGEPLVNFATLIKVLDLFTHEDALGLGSRRVTVSTAGLCPQILMLKQHSKVRLAISLHATTDEIRNKIMPINQKYNLKTLFQTLKEFQVDRKDSITLEYTLIEGINHSLEDAHRLIKLSRSIRSKVNLIPYNEHSGAPYKRPSKTSIQEFYQCLKQNDVTTMLRSTRGDDISAACGQLAVEKSKA